MCVRVCALWADLDALSDKTPEREKRTFVHTFICMCGHYVSIYSNVCQTEHLLVHACMRVNMCASMHVRVATSFTLGSLNVGHKALRHSSEMFGLRLTSPLIFQAVVSLLSRSLTLRD